MNDTTNLVPRLTELVDPNTSKYEQLEHELEEVKVNLLAVADQGMSQITELIGLAKASQNAKVYEVLAAMILANNRTHREVNLILKAKKDLIDAQAAGSSSVVDSSGNVTNNNLIMTTTDMIRMIRAAEKEEAADGDDVDGD